MTWSASGTPPRAVSSCWSRLRSWQLANPPCGKPGGSWNFGDLTLPVATVDASFEVNYLSVGAMTDPLDDFYGAVGRGTLKLAVSGDVTNGTDGRPASMRGVGRGCLPARHL